MDIFKQIVTTKEFIIILLVMLIIFPIIFSVASLGKKPSNIKKVLKNAAPAEKKSLNETQIPTA